MKISLCITTYQRLDMVSNSFIDVLNDDRISDICIMDDHSTDGSFEKLSQEYRGNLKVKVYRQPKNVGMSRNKKDAIAMSVNPWCIIFDDDNKIGPGYIDALYAVKDLFVNTYDIFMPDFAKPIFDYTGFDRANIWRGNVLDWTTRPLFGALINTCNYVVNRNFYLDTWIHNPMMMATDTAWHAYNHLKNDGAFYVVPGMTYDHRVHDESGFMKDVHYNMAQSGRIGELIKQLR